MKISGLTTVLTIIVLLTSACQPGISVTPGKGSPLAIGDAPDTPNNVSIQIDWVTLSNNIGDTFGSGDLFFELLVIRENGSSRKLVAPGQGSYKVFPGQQVDLGEFSLVVNDIGAEEEVLMYFLAFDSDEIDFLSNSAASIGVDGAIEALELGLESGVALQKTVVKG